MELLHTLFYCFLSAFVSVALLRPLLLLLQTLNTIKAHITTPTIDKARFGALGSLDMDDKDECHNIISFFFFNSSRFSCLYYDGDNYYKNAEQSKEFKII